jgi:hypothetical protein
MTQKPIVQDSHDDELIIEYFSLKLLLHSTPEHI